MKVKQSMKYLFSGLIEKFLSKKQKRVVILCYHSVSPSSKFASATPELFEEHLRWLKDHCYVVPFSQIFSLSQKFAISKKPIVAITFDDGYQDNYQYVFPLLKKYGLPATFFVTTGFIEKDSRILEHFCVLRRCGLEEITPLSWDQILEMHRSGLEIGSHTHSHFNLARLDSSSVEYELKKSKEILEDRLGTSIKLLAYPFGKYKRHFTKATLEIAQKVGYQYGAAVAFRAVREHDLPLALPRFFVTRDSIKVLLQKIYGAWDWLGWWQEKAPLWVARFISKKDFEV